MTFQSPDAELLHSLDQKFPPTGTIGYIIPLDATLALLKPFTADAPSNVITFAAPQKLKTGSRVRFTSTSTLPTPLTAASDYFLHRLTNTTFKVCTTLANAIAGTEINLMDGGSGTLNANEQALLKTDPIEVLLAHEFDAGVLSVPRLILENLGNATMLNGRAQKKATITIENASANDITIVNILRTRGGSAMIGSIPPGFEIETLNGPATILAGDSKIYNVKFEWPNP